LRPPQIPPPANSIFTTSTSATCRRRFADVPAGSDVADFRCPMCTSAELYSFHSAMRNVDFMAYYTRAQQATLVCTLKYT